MIEKISITELKEEADKIREKEEQVSIPARCNPWAHAAAIKLLCPGLSTSIEEHEIDMGELNYVTNYTIQVWW